MSPEERSSLDAIRRDAERMQHRRRRPGYSPLRGVSLFGAIGWSVATPTVAGAVLGLWLDRVAPARFSWPIALMLGGLVLGLIVAWEWVARENRAAQEEEQRAQTGKEQDHG